MNKKNVESIKGRRFEIDISDEACSALGLGFKHGDRIRHPNAGEGTVIGVAPATEGLDPEPNVLWYAIDGRDGKVSYSYPSHIVPA